MSNDPLNDSFADLFIGRSHQITLTDLDLLDFREAVGVYYGNLTDRLASGDFYDGDEQDHRDTLVRLNMLADMIDGIIGEQE